MKIILRSLVLTLIFISGVISVSAVTNIDLTDRWAWNDNKGWIEFYTSNTVEVTDEKINGYAIFYPDSTDYVSFDCATSPDDNICADSDYSVVNDGNGVLSGFAWNDTIGWISFSCLNDHDAVAPGVQDACADSDYGVTIETTAGPTLGDFSGWAWNDSTGWISFNCANTSDCGTSDYKVKTTWDPNAVTVSAGFVISNTFDTGVTEGAAFNSILWNGTLGQTGNAVKFQLATSNCSNGATDAPTCTTNVGWGGTKTSGEGAFIGPGGFTTSFYDPVGSGIPAQVVVTNHLNKRYYRYKMFIEKGEGNTISPLVNSIIINWSQ